jgi:Fe-S oxidoreductase
MNVDMATYKAEFLSHYYQGRLRPRSAYAMGLVMYWARLAALAPRLSNFVSHAPGLSTLFKAAGGIAPQREVPCFASFTFRRWFQSRAPQNPGGPPVMLYTDTFNDFFHPETAIAATEVLEAAGYRVQIPRRRVCCGRPLYDHGMLDLAERMLRRDLEVLSPVVEDGVPMIVLEPSCAAVFRDEMPDLLGEAPGVKRLCERTKILSEFVSENRPRFGLARLGGEAIVQPHCHQHAVLGMAAEKQVLSELGLDAEVLRAGCCGMAGSFGFEEGERYRVSMAAGERALLPKVRQTPPGALVLADGFSCRTQIEQGTGRKAIHLAEAMRRGLERPGSLGTSLRKRPGLPLRARLRRGAVAALLAWGAYRLLRSLTSPAAARSPRAISMRGDYVLRALR